MKEIGGYLDLESFSGEEYHKNAFRLNSVRNAIALIMKSRGYHKLWIPHYLCDSVRNMLDKYQLKYGYYHINKEFLPIFEQRLSDEEAILIVNYFGQIDNGQIQKLKEIYQNIIVDNTQAFFQQPFLGTDTVYTCRKYFGVPDGAYAYMDGDCPEYGGLETDKSFMRMGHILGRFENTASDFYEVFSDSECLLEQAPILKMSKLTRNLLKAIDYIGVQKKREKNFEALSEYLGAVNQMDVRNFGGCYMYPLLVKNGHAVRKKLIQNKIYVPTLWPNVLLDIEQGQWEYFLADNLVFIPIDQRYDPSDMEYICAVLKRILGGEQYGD